ncbi:LysR family transcriptional regulator [Mangrovactinospora gilvigrisea]|uniref:LysR family transcriptional regulator n=1 Tax=Mangrovactinospora gilvigrisea TaxID=1428644 RepID=A0A1J7BDY5_9ACTN|nr:LysR substrate-binding domain-containing protein [Mangrovactinospora gilvigrisea]OIV36883.1 LysR family transcriptional regulator [Mangrovactinospora gilvigrisea]
MELRQLRYFVTVAEELHFGRAAERLMIVQSAVSQQVRRLERELRFDLFDRSPRHVRLTSAGEAFLPAARAVLDAERAAMEVAAGFARSGAEGGRPLRVGTSTGMGERLDELLDVLERNDPAVQLELVAVPTAERLARVASGELDAAFARGVEEGDAPEGVRLLPVWRDELVVAFSGRHPLADAEAVALRELADQPLYLTARRENPPLVDLVVEACRDAGFEPVPGPARTALQDTLAAFGAGRAGWTVLYAAHASQLPGGRVAFRPVAGEGLGLPAVLAIRGGGSRERVAPLVAACRAVGAA